MKKIGFFFLMITTMVVAAFLLMERRVVVGKPHRGPVVQGVYGTGFVEADAEVPLSFQRSGRLVSLLVEEGQEVKAGQLLAALDMDHERAAVERLQAAQEQAHERYKRKKALFDKKNTSLEEMQEAQTAYQQAYFETEQARATLEQGEMRAPTDGFIIRKDKEVGEVLINDETFLWLSHGKVRITAEVDEEPFPLLRKGQMAQCQCPSFAQKTFGAKIYQITPKGDNTTRTYRIRLHPLNPHPALSIGMTVEVNVVVREDKNAMLIPTQAHTLGNVWVVRDNHLHKQPVTIGVQNDHNTEVLAGLSQSDHIVLYPQENMKEGQWVWTVNP